MVLLNIATTPVSSLPCFERWWMRNGTSAGRCLTSASSTGTYAINVATGTWRARTANGELARRLRNATRKLKRALGACSVRFRHVRAHMGEPGNEAADALLDALAKAAVKDAMMCGTSQNVLDLARRAHERAASARAGHDQRGQPAGRL